MNKLEELYKELKQKDKELDEYIETHRNHLSDEAEAIRKDIYRITDKINLLEKGREESKGYEDFKNRLLQRPITFLTEENLDKLEHHCKKAIHYERGVEHKVVLELLERYKELLTKREEDKKKIDKLQVLEDDLKDKRIVYVDTPEFEEKFIPKQKVKDKFNKLITRIKEFKDPEIKKYFSIEQIIELLEQFKNKFLEDK